MRLYLIFSFLFFSSFVEAQDFIQHQLLYRRVRTAKQKYDGSIKALCKSKGVTLSSNLFLRIHKQEQNVQVWIQKNNDKYILLKEYPICYTSGGLGPKRRQGDRQVPEGIYYINQFNPSSSFLLSMQINYPNASDKTRGYKASLGNLIFIHGNCVSLGCIAIEDEPITELYWICVQARNHQKRIPVHIFPYAMNVEKHKDILSRYRLSKDVLTLWNELHLIYCSFEKNKKINKITINGMTGSYKIINK